MKSIRTLPGKRAPIAHFAYSTNMLGAVRPDGTAALLSNRTGSTIIPLEVTGARAIAVSDELGLAYVATASQLLAFEIGGGMQEEEHPIADVVDLLVHPDHLRIALRTSDGLAHVLDLDAGNQTTLGPASRLLWRDDDPLAWPDVDASAIARQPRSGVLALGHSDGRMTLVRPDGSERGTWSEHGAPIVGAAFTPHFLVTASVDGHIVAWDIKEPT